MSELFDAVDALIAGQSPLPLPAERKRLRQAHGLSQDQVATALQVRRATVISWEAGKTEPRPPHREAYARLLDKLAALYPDDSPPDAAQQPPGPAAAPAPSSTVAAPSLPDGPPAPDHRAPDAKRSVTSRSSATTTRKPSPDSSRPPAADSRFANGPLAVIDSDDGQISAYCVGGLVLGVSATSIAALVEWTLSEAQLGAPRLHPAGQDADPLLVLTEAACTHFGLPARLTQQERLEGRLPEDHTVVAQLHGAQWQLTRRGFGPWARIYRPAQGAKRSCVQLCLPSWEALDARHWDGAAQLPPAELALLLGTYATRVMTPRGSTAVTGLELMTALRPPTRASAPDETGRRHREHNPGSLGTEPVSCAPCEAPDGHPLLADLPRFHQRTPAEMLVEEAYDWARPLTDDECTHRYVVGLDVNMAFAAAANGLTVGLGAPTHLTAPVFDKRLPGAWLVDLSHIDVDERLPSPFTPTGEKPDGPAWYATPTVAYALELGHRVAPLQAWVRRENGRYLDRWYRRLRDAYVETMADLGVTAGMAPADFLDAMTLHKQSDPQLAIVLAAIKASVKGGIGKLRERPRGGGWRPGRAWPALSRPTWRPDIRAAIISAARINMHRKMTKLADTTGQYPVAILSDCIVYPSQGPSPLDVLPCTDGKPVPGSFRLGVSPGMVKHEGTQTVLWAEGLREAHGQELNLARYIKTGQVAAAERGE